MAQRTWIFHDSDGEIRRVVRRLDDEVPEVVDTLTRIESPIDVSARTHHIVAGAPVAYTDEQATAKDLVVFSREWRNASMSWVDLRTLAHQKLAKWDEIRDAASASDQAPITIGANTYAVDAASRAAFFHKVQISQMAVTDGLTFSVDWMLADGSSVTLNATQIKAGARAIDARGDAIRSKAKTLRAAIAAASTSAEVAAITWTWP